MKTYIGKQLKLDGSVKYVYAKGKCPQDKYYRSEKGQANELKIRNSENRQQYLREYYKKNRDKMIKTAMRNYWKKTQKK